MKSRWTAAVNQLENYEIKITLQWIKWKIMNQPKNISTAVEILSPRWKYFHRGGNISVQRIWSSYLENNVGDIHNRLAFMKRRNIP